MSVIVSVLVLTFNSWEAGDEKLHFLGREGGRNCVLNLSQAVPNWSFCLRGRKVNFSLTTPWGRGACRGIVPHILMLDARSRSVVKFTFRPPCPHESTSLPIEEERWWSPEPGWIFWRRAKSITPAGNRRIDCSACNLVNMLKNLFWLSFPTKRICKQNGGLWSGEDKSLGSVDAVDDSVAVTAVG
jgi:hypothetical protein